ncbi:MAG: hypothetical protein IKK84_00035 [Clostridia bacterium]|nr:hypothetical protein [Clostridia bacterium]
MKDLKDFQSLEKQVEELLKKYPDTRRDDMCLYYWYCRDRVGCLSNDVFTKLFELSYIRKAYGVKSYSSVSRARRKVQAKHPELKDIEAVAIRSEQENLYKEYAIS